MLLPSRQMLLPPPHRKKRPHDPRGLPLYTAFFIVKLTCTFHLLDLLNTEIPVLKKNTVVVTVPCHARTTFLLPWTDTGSRVVEGPPVDLFRIARGVVSVFFPGLANDILFSFFKTGLGRRDVLVGVDISGPSSSALSGVVGGVEMAVLQKENDKSLSGKSSIHRFESRVVFPCSWQDPGDAKSSLSSSILPNGPRRPEQRLCLENEGTTFGKESSRTRGRTSGEGSTIVCTYAKVTLSIYPKDK